MKLIQIFESDFTLISDLKKINSMKQRGMDTNTEPTEPPQPYTHYFNTNTTGSQYWDNLCKDPNVQCTKTLMHPADYILQASKILNFPVAGVLNSREEAATDMAYDEMQHGGDFPSLVLDYYTPKPNDVNAHKWGQDGFHRAMAANMIGIDKVPVYIFKPKYLERADGI